MVTLLDDTDLLPLGDDVCHILTSLVGSDIIRLAEFVSQHLCGEIAYSLCLFPQPCCRIIQTQQPTEVNGTEAFTDNHLLTAYLTQYKTILYSHNSLKIGRINLLTGRSLNHSLAASLHHQVYK